jgi:hypothetical protein
MSKFKIKLTGAQLAVINEFINYIKLGDDNIYEEAISDLAIQMEKDGSLAFINNFYNEEKYSKPEITTKFSESDGFTFVVDEFAG